MRGRCEDYEELESGLGARQDFHAAFGEMQMKVEIGRREEQGGREDRREGS